jgi:hypothetical protein
LPIVDCRFPIGVSALLLIGNRQLEISNKRLLCLFMVSVFAATATELAELKPIRRGLFILGRYVVATLAINTLKNNIIAWHFLTS